MNENELHERIIDYVEGNISSELKSEIESFIAKSPQIQNEVDLIQSAFTELRNSTDDNVPSYYFSNFLPRLRERLENGKVHIPISIPELARLFAAPSIVAIVVLSLVTMYQIFRPEEKQSSIYSLVNGMEQTDINLLTIETTDFGTTIEVFRAADIFAVDIANITAIESKLTEDLLVLDVSVYQNENELLSDMGDQEAEQVLQLLDKPNVQ